MTHLLVSDQQKVKAEIARQLEEAVRDADAHAGRDPRAIFRAHSDFDFEDVLTGELLHDPDCLYCRVRKLERRFNRIKGVLQ